MEIFVQYLVHPDIDDPLGERILSNIQFYLTEQILELIFS